MLRYPAFPFANGATFLLLVSECIGMEWRLEVTVRVECFGYVTAVVTCAHSLATITARPKSFGCEPIYALRRRNVVLRGSE